MLYYFHLTDGDEVIRDEEGIHVSSVQAAAAYALEVIAELRQEDAFYSDDWQDWRLEITDPSGRIVRIILLDPQPQAQVHYA